MADSSNSETESGASSGRLHHGRAAVNATFLTVVGYGTTLLLQVVYARVLGVTGDVSALAVALTWAIATAGFVGTTFASVMVPAYVRHIEADPRRATNLLRTASTLALAIGIGVALMTWIMAPTLAGLLLAEASSVDVLSLLLQMAAPLIPLWIMVVSMTALANARGRFAAAAASTIVPSLVVVAALTLTHPASVEMAVAGYSGGAVVQIGTLAFIVRRWLGDLVPRPSWHALAPLSSRLVPIGLVFLVLSVAALMMRSIAAYTGEDGPAVVDYATRLVVAGESALLTGVLAVALTAWSHEAAASGAARPRSLVGTLGFSFGLLVPIAAAVAIFAPEVVAVLFGGGQFSPSDVASVASFLRWMALGIAAHSFLMIALRAQLAMDATWSIVSMAVVHIVVLGLVGLAALPLLGVDGVALGYSLSWVGAAFVTVVSLRVTTHAGVLAQELGRACVATAVAAVPTAIVLMFAPESAWMRLVLGGATFALSGLAVGRAIHVPFVMTVRDEVARSLVRRLA